MTSAIFYTYLTIVHLLAWGGLYDSQRSAEVAAAVRKPTNQYTITAHGDSVHNPPDFRLAWSIEQASDPWTHRFSLERERQHGRYYWGGEQFVERKAKHWAFGYSIEDWEEDSYYLSKLWWEVRAGGILGFGVTRSYSERWFDAGTWMARLSIESSQPLGAVTLVTSGTYEFNDSKQNASLRFDMRGLMAGPVEIIPSAYWKRTDTASRWLAEVKARVTF